MSFPDFASEAEMLVWLRSAPAYAELRQAMERGPLPLRTLALLHYPLHRLSAAELRSLLPLSASAESLLRNPSLTEAQALEVLELEFREGMQKDERFHHFTVLLAAWRQAGYAVPLRSYFERLMARVRAEAGSPASSSDIRAHCLLHHFWFELEPADLEALWKVRGPVSRFQDELLLHPRASRALVQEIFEHDRRAGGLMRGLALCPRLSEIPGGRKHLLGQGNHEILALYASRVDEREFEAVVAEMTSRSGIALLNFLRALPPRGQQRLQPEHFLPLLQDADPAVRLGGQLLFARLGLPPRSLPTPGLAR